jgi:DNA-binding MarR family transcriptional regulator
MITVETSLMDKMTSLDTDRNSLWRLFLTVHTRLVQQVEQDFKQAGLPPFEWYDVLVALKQAPDQQLRLSELADVLLVNRTNVTRLVDRLENAGLLKRKTCKDDRRGAFAVLTKAGLEMQQKMWTIYSQSIAEYFGRYLTEADVAAFTQALSAMLAGLDASEDTQAHST